MLIGAALAIPFTGGASAAAVAALSAAHSARLPVPWMPWKAEYGISKDFVRQVGVEAVLSGQ